MACANTGRGRRRGGGTTPTTSKPSREPGQGWSFPCAARPAPTAVRRAVHRRRLPRDPRGASGGQRSAQARRSPAAFRPMRNAAGSCNSAGRSCGATNAGRWSARSRLSRAGIRARRDTGSSSWKRPDASRGEFRRGRLSAHEFHHAAIEGRRTDAEFAYCIRRGVDGENDGVVIGSLVASFSHLRDTPEAPWVERFVAFARARRRGARSSTLAVAAGDRGGARPLAARAG